jgi:alpha-L-rhamnosidase
LLTVAMLKEYLPIISTLHLLFLGPVLCCQVVTDQIWLDGLLLKTDDVATPLSVFIDQIQPKISYSLRQLPSERPVCQQTARRMHVFDVEDQTFVWNDSDWITSTDNIGIEWNGTDLASNRRYTLWIDILNSDATVTTSPNVSFGTAMMAQHCPNGDCWQSAGWLAADITPESDCESFGHHPVQMLRHTMTLPKSVSRAYLHVVGLGWYQAFVNGKRVGDRALDPALSVYNETVFYTTYDVTANISKGDNVLGVLLGRGWFNNVHMHLFGKFDLHQIMTSGHERARTVLSVRYTDGSEASFPSQSGPDWQCAADLHPVVQNSVFFGEVVELNRHPDIEGWSTSSYQPTSAWSTCLPTDGTVTREGITTQLPTPSLHRMEGIFERETILPIAVTPLSATSVLVDFGAEFSGGVDVTLRHQPPMPDDDVMFIYGEQLNASSGGVDGASLYPGALGRWEQGNTSVWGPCAFSWPPTGRVTGRVGFTGDERCTR